MELTVNYVSTLGGLITGINLKLPILKLLQSIRRLLKMRQCFSIACSCTIRGSVSRDDCNPSTGQCDCWHGYTGRRCDNCTVGYEKNERGVCSGIENII